MVGINDISDLKTNTHLLKYGSILGKWDADVQSDKNSLIVDGKILKCVSESSPLNLPWTEWKVDLIIESTGVFITEESTSKHLVSGAKKVLITTPARAGNVGTYVVGINHKDYDHDKHNVISNSSCTTNCLAPVIKVINDNFGIIKGTMTAIHSYMGDQRILDASHRDLRRARAAAVNIIPTSTGAAKEIALVIPELKGKLNGIAMRVPTPNVSVVDLVVQVKKNYCRTGK